MHAIFCAGQPTPLSELLFFSLKIFHFLHSSPLYSYKSVSVLMPSFFQTKTLLAENMSATTRTWLPEII